MSQNAAIAKEAIEQFQRIQAHMKTAKEENAIKTYAGLKQDYLSLKVLLQVLCVNLTDIDEIKE